MDEKKLLTRIKALKGDEPKIVETLLDRMDDGRADYGPWKVDDSRDYVAEGLAEVIDGLLYCAAGLVRLKVCAHCGKHHREEFCA